MIDFIYKLKIITQKPNKNFKKQTLSEILIYLQLKYLIKTLNANFIRTIKQKSNQKKKPNSSYFLHTSKVNLKEEVEFIKEKLNLKRRERLLVFFQTKFFIFNWKSFLDFRNSQDFIHKVFLFLSKHIGTYKSSIQELVEGQREVIHNDEFLFDDGETAKEKTNKFERKFKENFSIKEIISKYKNNNN